MSKIIHWICSNKLILLLTTVTFIVLAIPLLRYGVGGTFFYRTDPDVVYVTNAILFIKSGVVFYADHPGTPTIVLMSFLYVPLRFLAQYYFHQSFLQWSFDNFALLLYYSRFCQLTLYCSALFVFLKVIAKTSKSITITLFSWFAFFWVMGVDRSISVVPENLSILLTAVWLYFFTKFLSKKSFFLNIVLVIISAFAVANKFTSTFLLIPSLLLVIFIKNLTFKQKIVRLGVNILAATIIFYIGILPAIGRVDYVVNWVKGLFLHADVYGTGVASVFDLKSYASSVYQLILSEDAVPFIITCLTIALAIYLIRKNEIKKNDPIIFLTFSTFIGMVIFAKYPETRYFLVNLALILFCLSYFLAKTNFVLLPKINSKLTLTNLLLLFFIILFVGGVSAYLIDATVQLKPYINLQTYVYKNPAKINTLWSGYENVDYTLYTWTNVWSADVFKDQFEVKPALQLAGNLRGIYSSDGNNKNVFDFCWDKVYFSKDRAMIFLNLYKDKNLKSAPIPGDPDIYEITSTHCTMK